MTSRPTSRILEEVTEERGKQATLGRKLRTNRDRNWLLALILNSFAKNADGVPPNELDTILMSAFVANGLGEQLKRHGELYTKMAPRVRQELFPGAFGMLAEHADYTLEDLARDLPELDAAVRAMPNAVDVDVVGVHLGKIQLSDFRRASRSVRRTHAGELFRAVAPDSPRTDADSSTDTFRIKASRFHCSDETGSDFFGSDEVYWIFGSVGAGAAVTTRTRIFEDVDSGDTVSFGGTEGWIWGQDGRPQALPEGEIGTLVQLWEHDTGDPDEAKAAVAAAFAAAAGVLAATGVAAWVAAVVAGVGAVVQWLLGFLDDDHIGDQAFVFTRQTILDQAGKVGQSFDVTRQLTDGGGDYTVNITVTHVGPPSTTTTVPDVREARRGAAISAVLTAGLVPHTTGPDAPSAWVSSQSPNAGAVVDRGSSVNLRLRTGPLP